MKCNNSIISTAKSSALVNIVNLFKLFGNAAQIMNESTKVDFNFQISITTKYIKAQSNPDQGQFTFAYTITISNHGNKAAKLISRQWVIQDSNGKTQKVKGAGVVGKFPYLRPGESFEYTSGATLKTPVGAMHGSYQMQSDDGITFDLPIPAFSLTARSEIVLH